MLQKRSCNKSILYKIKVSNLALEQLDRTLEHILFAFRSEQAMVNILSDFWKTVESLTIFADVTQELEWLPGYRRKNLSKHNYLVLYRIEGDTVYMDYFSYARRAYENMVKWLR